MQWVATKNSYVNLASAQLARNSDLSGCHWSKFQTDSIFGLEKMPDEGNCQFLKKGGVYPVQRITHYLLVSELTLAATSNSSLETVTKVTIFTFAAITLLAFL